MNSWLYKNIKIQQVIINFNNLYDLNNNLNNLNEKEKHI